MNELLVALDVDTIDEARRLANTLRGWVGGFKIGSRLFTAHGPAFVEELVGRGDRVFLDLKFHDIPHTVAQACRAAARLGVWMVNVHASGGPRMLAAAREALEGLERRPLLIAVTVLTSMGPEELGAIGIDTGPEQQVLRLARLTAEAGLDGVVCSALEAPALRRELGPDFRLVTPGIRPAGGEVGDQTRVLTPIQALRAGADYLVIGRPITQSAEPVATLKQISAEIGARST